jgi:YbbR domain-containing protein
MYDIWKRNITYKLLAVLLAALLWFYVTNLQNLTDDRNLTVPILYYNLKEGLVVENKPKEIEIKIRGPHSIVNLLSSKDIKASVDLAKAKLGENDYFVEVILPSGVERVHSQPSSIKLLIDEIREKQLPIEVVTKGKVAASYSSFEPLLEPSTVLVKGARRMLQNIETAQVTVNLEQAKDTLALNLPVTLLTKDGKEASNQFTISPEYIQVFVPVTENKPNKTVSIKPIIKGEPEEGFRVSRVILDPETVKITGSYDVLSQINQVVTAPIDITGIVENSATQVALVPPEGANLLYAPVVKVLVQVETTPVTKIINDLPITVKPQEGHKYIIKPEKVHLTLKGSKEEIAALDTTAIKVYVDVDSLGAGTHNLAVKVNIADSLHVLKIEPSTVEVKIIKDK